MLMIACSPAPPQDSAARSPGGDGPGRLPDKCPHALSWQEGLVGRALDVWAAVDHLVLLQAGIPLSDLVHADDPAVLPLPACEQQIPAGVVRRRRTTRTSGETPARSAIRASRAAPVSDHSFCRFAATVMPPPTTIVACPSDTSRWAIPRLRRRARCQRSV